MNKGLNVDGIGEKGTGENEEWINKTKDMYNH